MRLTKLASRLKVVEHSTKPEEAAMPAVTADTLTLPRVFVAPGAQPRSVKMITNAPQAYEGDALHQINNYDDEPLRILYLFATPHFSDVIYKF